MWMHTYFTPRSWFLAKMSAVVKKFIAVEVFGEESEFNVSYDYLCYQKVEWSWLFILGFEDKIFYKEDI